MINAIVKKLNRKNKKGFTLIELIVVIAIVAVLAAVGIPAIAGQVGKSQKASAESNAKLLATQFQIMATNAEAKGFDSKNIDDGSAAGIATGITATTVDTGVAISAASLAKVADAAGVKLDASAFPKATVTVAPIKEGTEMIGQKVVKVVFETSSSVKGEWPLS